MNKLVVTLIVAGALSAFGCAAPDQEGASRKESALVDGTDEGCEAETGSSEADTRGPNSGAAESDSVRVLTAATASGTGAAKRTCPRSDEGAACAVDASLEARDPAEFRRQLAACAEKGAAWEAKNGKRDPNPGNVPSPPPAPALK